MVLLHSDWFVFIPTPHTQGWMVRAAVSAAGHTLIHSSVKLKLTRVNSESECSQLQPVSQKTRLCNQITAARTGTVAIFQLCNIWVKVGIPDEDLEPSQSTFPDRIDHDTLTKPGPYSKRS